ncbi:hypothetical protein KSS87_022960, partial [Heliosperma pusillum]
MQITGNETRKTHCLNKKLQCKQWVMQEDSHKDLQCKQLVIKQGRLILYTRSYNANNRFIILLRSSYLYKGTQTCVGSKNA